MCNWHRVVTHGRAYTTLTQTIDDYVNRIKQRFGHFKTCNNNHDVGLDMSMYMSVVEKNW